MSDLDLLGHYEAGGMFTFSIVEREGRLFISQPAIPDEFDPALDWTGPASVRVMSGPMEGAEVVADLEDGRVVGGLVSGAIPFLRTDVPPEPTPGDGLRAPVLSDDPERDASFEEVWDKTGPGEQATVLEPHLLHEFVQWLIQKDEYIFHGSGKTDIDVFEPRRESLELMNYHGGGNLGAVYGTHQGLWAMFFAVVAGAGYRARSATE